ncbi:hypothetical protein HAX54_013128 [Datura stramonium]|uniref:Uncharacterized protein n=1 Tax=Datura stramonium TaxID=4076 RepID=A0ABS8TNL4_DATST|nr:hypothetical protein [Datura stramonium]
MKLRTSMIGPGAMHMPDTVWAGAKRKKLAHRVPRCIGGCFGKKLVVMAPKASKGKGVAFLSQASKRFRKGKEAPNEDASMQPQPPRRYGLY